MRNLMIGLLAGGVLACLGLVSSPAKAAPPVLEIKQQSPLAEEVRYRRRYARRGYYGRRYYGRPYVRGRYVRRPARRTYRRAKRWWW